MRVKNNRYFWKIMIGGLASIFSSIAFGLTCSGNGSNSVNVGVTFTTTNGGSNIEIDPTAQIGTVLASGSGTAILDYTCFENNTMAWTMVESFHIGSGIPNGVGFCETGTPGIGIRFTPYSANLPGFGAGSHWTSGSARCQAERQTGRTGMYSIQATGQFPFGVELIKTGPISLPINLSASMQIARGTRSSPIGSVGFFATMGTAISLVVKPPYCTTKLNGSNIITLSPATTTAVQSNQVGRQNFSFYINCPNGGVPPNSMVIFASDMGNSTIQNTSGDAQGAGVQITYNNQIVPLNSTLNSATSPAFFLPNGGNLTFAANYQRINNETLRPGKLNATATFTFNYP